MTSAQFENLVESTSDSIYKVVYFMLRDQNESQDVVQETYIKFWENHSDDKFDNPRAYLMTMAKNLSIDKIRKKKAQLKMELDLHQNQTLNKKEEDKVEDTKSKYQAILNYVNTLKEKQKEVFVLREIDGLTYQEISEYLKISENQVKVTLHRVRSSIKKQFENLIS